MAMSLRCFFSELRVSAVTFAMSEPVTVKRD